MEDCYTDSDGDGFGSTIVTSSALEDYACLIGNVANNDDDCDDTEENTHPGASLFEQDVDGDGSFDCTQDIDGDGYGDLYVTGSIIPGTDCDDTDESVYVGAPEICDGQDNACDSVIPEEEIDDDLDGFVECSIDSDGWDGSLSNGFTAMLGDDCDDTDILINPATFWYGDGDGDGFGDANTSLQACETPVGYVNNDDDCNDASSLIGDTRSWYEDGDGDGIDANTISTDCEMPTGYSHQNGDCDDNDPDNAQVCLDFWDGISISGAAKGIVHNNDRDRFANVFAQGEINGVHHFVFGTAYRKYENSNLRGGVFLFDDLLSVGDTTEATLTINGTSSVSALGTALVIDDVTQDGVNDVLVSATIPCQLSMCFRDIHFWDWVR